MTEARLVETLVRARKLRRTHPKGKLDGGRWYPTDRESCECCSHVHCPTVRWPGSLEQHCRSRKHIQALVTKLGPLDPGLIEEADQALNRFSYSYLD
jgi:hypothetical protein